MFEYQYEQVALQVINKQTVDEDGYVCWMLPDGKEVSDFDRCVSEWEHFLNDNLKSYYRGY